MVPPGRDRAPGRDAEPAEPTQVTIDEGALYVVVRKAVEDAILGAIGTVLLVGIALVLVWMGVAMALGSGSQTGIAPVVIGAVFALVGLYVGAATLRVIPPIREWF